MEDGDLLPWVHPGFRHLVFIAEKKENSFTFVVVTANQEFLKYHPFSLHEYPKIKFQNCLRIPDINPVKFLDSSTWTMFFCSKVIDTSLIYDIMLPYFQADAIKLKEGVGEGSTPEMIQKLDFYQTQPRSEQYFFYRTLLCALRYICRAKGLSKNHQKQLFFVLRMSFLDQVEKDLKPKTVTGNTVHFLSRVVFGW